MSTELKQKKESDLKKMLREKRNALREFYFGLAGSKTRNVKEGKKLKKEIAQILTELRLRRIKEEESF